MKKIIIEYKVFVRSEYETMTSLEEWLNEKGKDGWELVKKVKEPMRHFVNDRTYVFSRTTQSKINKSKPKGGG